MSFTLRAMARALWLLAGRAERQLRLVGVGFGGLGRGSGLGRGWRRKDGSGRIGSGLLHLRRTALGVLAHDLLVRRLPLRLQLLHLGLADHRVEPGAELA